MARLILLVTALLVLPWLIAAASDCRIAVTQTKTATSNYVEYSATVLNRGSLAATDIILEPSKYNIKQCSLAKNADGDYLSPINLAAGESFKFTYSMKRGNSITWTSWCTQTSHIITPVPVTYAEQIATNYQTPTATSKPTNPVTQKPISTPKPTSTPKPISTPKPSNGGGNRICPAGTWWAPAPLTTWQWQLTGTIDTSINVQMYDIDLFDATTGIINTLHSKGKVVICYFSSQYENWRADASSFPSSVIGAALDGWPGENWVDVRSTAVRNAIKGRLDLAVSKGCDGVEPDNVDGYTMKTGFPITANDQLNYNKFLAAEAHARGLSVGIKNDVDQINALQPYFDWAINEQCKQYSECGAYSAFTKAGKAVFNCEYKGSSSSVCPAQNTAKLSTIIKTLDLTASITAQCCSSLSQPCAPATYTCKSSASARYEQETYELRAAAARRMLEQEALARGEELEQEPEAEVQQEEEEVSEEVAAEDFAEEDYEEVEYEEEAEEEVSEEEVVPEETFEEEYAEEASEEEAVPEQTSEEEYTEEEYTEEVNEEEATPEQTSEEEYVEEEAAPEQTSEEEYVEEANEEEFAPEQTSEEEYVEEEASEEEVAPEQTSEEEYVEEEASEEEATPEQTSEEEYAEEEASEEEAVPEETPEEWTEEELPYEEVAEEEAAVEGTEGEAEELVELPSAVSTEDDYEQATEESAPTEEEINLSE